MTHDGRAQTTSSTFRRSCTVSITIDAEPLPIWELLTDADGYPRWNSTVTSISGSIALGQKLRVSVPASKRAFSPTVTEFAAPRSMTWRDGNAVMFQGVRVFTLEPTGDGGTAFTMTETFSGAMMPLIGRSLPDFNPIFEQYATDLKREAERNSKGTK